MKKLTIDPKILKKIKEKTQGKLSEHSIRPAISRIKSKYGFLTDNSAAEVFSKKHGFSIQRYLNEKDRDTLKSVEIKKIEIPQTRPRQKKKIVKIAIYETDDKFLKKHLDEINRAYTYGCYTATFILCRKFLENLIVHHILKKKYPKKTLDHREKYFDINNRRNLFFNKLIENLRSSSKDFLTEKSLVERICQLADGFRETANEMTHSLYHIAKKREIDNKDFQELLDLIARLENNLVNSTI